MYNTCSFCMVEILMVFTHHSASRSQNTLYLFCSKHEAGTGLLYHTLPKQGYFNYYGTTMQTCLVWARLINDCSNRSKRVPTRYVEIQALAISNLIKMLHYNCKVRSCQFYKQLPKTLKLCYKCATYFCISSPIG